MNYFLAIDLGASSGRHIVGHVEDEKIILDEIYRFENGVKSSDNHLVWDIDSLFQNILTGIKKSFEKYPSIVSLSIDTWGVDYALIKEDGSIVKPVFAYRDDRTEDDIALVNKKCGGFETMYERTGIQFNTFNTIYQLHDDLVNNRLDGISNFLMLPELFSYMLTGKMVKDYTMASTTGMVNCNTLQYDLNIVEKLGLPKEMFKELYKPGKLVGRLKKEYVEYIGHDCDVIVCPSHDTASAFEAIDCGSDSIIVSSGTWSLIGTKLENAETSLESMDCGFSNEGGVGYFRYLKNIMGMWLINSVQRKYNMPITEIVELAESSDCYELFDVNDHSLFAPVDMEEAINKLLKKYDGAKFVDHSYLFASIYHSLAESYNVAVKGMEVSLNTTFKDIYIVGGGAKNKYLNKLVEKYTGKVVHALPIEATVIGNIKTQIKNFN